MNDFVSQNVTPVRLESCGKGETKPRAVNTTEAGRQLNRRVEMSILPVLANEFA
ncbi:OmpA family protein [Thiobacillus sp.]